MPMPTQNVELRPPDAFFFSLLIISWLYVCPYSNNSRLQAGPAPKTRKSLSVSLERKVRFIYLYKFHSIPPKVQFKSHLPTFIFFRQRVV